IGSCERFDMTVGFPPDNPLLQTKYYEYVPESYMILNDSLYDLSSGKLLVGQYNDPNFGVVTAHSYMDMVSSGGIYPIVNSSDNIDSTVLTLYYDHMYGQSLTSQHKLNFYMLTEPYTYEQKKNAYTFTELSTDRLISTVSLNLNTQLANGDQDTLKVPFSDVFGTELIRGLASVERPTTNNASDSIIRSVFPGLKISPDPANGGVVSFNGGFNALNLSFYFSSAGDTVSKVITVSNSNIQHNTIEPNSVVSDRLGTPLEGLTNYKTSFVAPDNYVYVQNSTGVNAVFDFQPLKGFYDTLNSIVVTSAIFEISNVQSINSNSIPDYFELYLTNASNELFVNRSGLRRKVFRGMSSDSLESSKINTSTQIYPVTLDYSDSTKTYQGDLSLYIQSIIESGNDLPRVIIKDVRRQSTLNQVYFSNQDVRLKILYSTRVAQ
ncbi:MAG: DUF4270 domain-containing protein, partial [Cyclobacteriaceae bacterium]|nr:DUF4270 domain-containing protein [Cyclobacteriaceae bacterium]